jgi:hypothetical protein
MHGLAGCPATIWWPGLANQGAAPLLQPLVNR